MYIVGLPSKGVWFTPDSLRYKTRININSLWWTGMSMHLFWVPSEMIPADDISGIGHANIVSVTEVTIEAKNKWSTLMNDLSVLKHIGAL